MEVVLKTKISTKRCGKITILKLQMAIIIKIIMPMLDMKVSITVGDIQHILTITIITISQAMEQVDMVDMVAMVDMVMVDMEWATMKKKQIAGIVVWMTKKKKDTIQPEMKLKKMPDYLENIDQDGWDMVATVVMVVAQVGETKKIKRMTKKKKVKLLKVKERLKKKPRLKKAFHLNLIPPKLLLKFQNQAEKTKVKQILKVMMIMMKLRKLQKMMISMHKLKKNQLKIKLQPRNTRKLPKNHKNKNNLKKQRLFIVLQEKSHQLKKLLVMKYGELQLMV